VVCQYLGSAPVSKLTPTGGILEQVEQLGCQVIVIEWCHHKPILTIRNEATSRWDISTDYRFSTHPCLDEHESKGLLHRGHGHNIARHQDGLPVSIREIID
jgi:hypothetical protein